MRVIGINNILKFSGVNSQDNRQSFNETSQKEKRNNN